MLGINGPIGGTMEFAAVSQQILLALRRSRMQFPMNVRSAARNVFVEEPPRTSVDERSLTWIYVMTGGGESYATEIDLSIDRDPGTARETFLVESFCDCPAFEMEKTCGHCCAAVDDMEIELRTAPPEHLERVARLVSKLKGKRGGRWMVEQLVRLAEQETRNEVTPGFRLQWRLRFWPTDHRQPLRISAYQQKLTARGKWSPGRIMDWSHYSFRDVCKDSPRDTEAAQMLRSLMPAYSSYDTPIWESLDTFVGHPHTVWDDEQQTPVRVEPSSLSMAIEPVSDEAYQCVLRMGDLHVRPADPIRPVALCGAPGGFQRLLMADHQGDRLLFSQKLRSSLAVIVRGVMETEQAVVPLTVEEARQLTGSAGRLGQLIRVDVPEQLAGPREEVVASVAILLRPHGEGIGVSLRATDSRFAEPMVPGQGPAEVTAVTEEGLRRLVRDLEEERGVASRWAAMLPLEPFSGGADFSWHTDNIELAVELLDTLRGLEQGPEVLWPEGKKIRMVGEITPSCLRVQVEERRDWFGISGTLQMEGADFPLSELLEAIRRGGKYIRVGDSTFARIDDAFRRRLEQLGDTLQNDRGSVRVAQVAVPSVQELLGDDCLLEATVRWRETLERLEKVRKMRPRVPQQLQADLREYQKEGYRWLARLSAWGAGAVLADDMGLGKTLQALGVLIDRSTEGPALIVAPTSVGENWQRETNRFAPVLNPQLYRDHDRDALVENAGPGDLVITSYALLQRDAARFLARPWHTLILDEAQYIKNAATKTARAARDIQADWRLALSGTPLENHVGELWSLMRTISPGLLGSWEHFRTRFADPIEKHGDDERRKSLARLVQPFILRRTKRAVLSELPPRTEVNLYAEMGTTERQRYEAARMAAIKELAGGAAEDNEGQQRFRVLAWLTRMRQLACHPRLVDASWKGNSAKMNLLLDTISDLREGGHRALVFSQFVQHLGLVREALDERKISYQYLDGATPASQRQERVDAFQRGEGELFLISLKAGGTGLNLTAADYVLHLDPWWNPAVEDQATDRAHRMGQERPVTVFRLVARDTIEEQILALHADKRELVAGVLDGTDRAGRMSTTELIQLIHRGAK